MNPQPAVNHSPLNRRRMGGITMALMASAALAAGGGAYTWREIAPPQQSAATSQHHVPPAITGEYLPIPESPAPDEMPAPLPPTAITRDADPEPPEPPAALPGDSITIEHGQPQDAVPNPELSAAWQSYQDGDYSAASKHYTEVLRQDAHSRDALLGLAAIAQRQGEDGVAAQYYDQVLALDPRDAPAHAGLSALAVTDSAGMESRLKLLLEQQPQAAVLHFALGNMLAAQARWSEARQAYLAACKLEPAAAQYAFNLAVSLDHLGQDAAAARQYRRALQLDAGGTAGFDPARAEERAARLSRP